MRKTFVRSRSCERDTENAREKRSRPRRRSSHRRSRCFGRCQMARIVVLFYYYIPKILSSCFFHHHFSFYTGTGEQVESYWKDIAEQRRLALLATLKENEKVFMGCFFLLLNYNVLNSIPYLILICGFGKENGEWEIWNQKEICQNFFSKKIFSENFFKKIFPTKFFNISEFVVTFCHCLFYFSSIWRWKPSRLIALRWKRWLPMLSTSKESSVMYSRN